MQQPNGWVSWIKFVSVKKMNKKKKKTHTHTGVSAHAVVASRLAFKPFWFGVLADRQDSVSLCFSQTCFCLLKLPWTLRILYCIEVWKSALLLVII